MTSDEIVTRAADVLQRGDDEAFQWAIGRTQPPGPEPGPSPVPPPPGPGPIDPGPVTIRDSHRQVVRRNDLGAHDAVMAELREFLDAHRDSEVEVTWRVVE